MQELLPKIYQITTRLTGLKVPSAMHIVKAGGDVILIDPFALSESEMEGFDALGNPGRTLDWFVNCFNAHILLYV